MQLDPVPSQNARNADLLAGRSRRKGFTLIELSIVLVIIGLIVGGILVGRDLIHAAGLRKVIEEKEAYITAIQTFREKYNALPGDMPNATDYWGTDVGCSSTIGSLVPTVPTCNGNNDSFIALGNSGQENLRMWQHLADAGLIAGLYSGHPAGSQYTCTGGMGKNVPLTQASIFTASTGWCLQNLNKMSVNGDGLYYGHFYGTELELGDGSLDNGSFSGVVSAGDAYSLDIKFDDGMPGSGAMITNPPCGATGWSSTAAVYQPTSSSKCVLYFELNL